jgi:excisionase family DNA binding protein
LKRRRCPVVVPVVASVRYLRVNVVAARLGLKPFTIYQMVKDGRLPAVHFGRVIRIDPADLQRFIEDGRKAPGVKYRPRKPVEGVKP